MSHDRRLNILDRTLSNLWRAWIGISDTTRYYIYGQRRPDLPDEDLVKVRQDIGSCIGMKGDEASARSSAAALGNLYMSLNRTGRIRFLSDLSKHFGVDRKGIDEAMAAVQNALGQRQKRTLAEAQLRIALEPRWRRLLGRFTTLPEGVKFLVDLRAEMLSMVEENSFVRELSDDLRSMLSAWFDVGLLELHQINWDSPAALLEKLIAYEAVHAIRSWDDMKNRLGSDRRCFGFFHPNMPNEPLIFVEIALVKGVSSSIDKLLDENVSTIDPQHADAAIFYSISNAQRGLDGISFGNFLIKRVVEELSHEFNNLKTFATLSPIPGFAIWLNEILDKKGSFGLKNSERKILAKYHDVENEAEMLSFVLKNIDWVSLEDTTLTEILKNFLIRQAAFYLCTATNKYGRVRDPVAHFHLSNGAIIDRLNWMADKSQRGLKQSHGIMVNYLYRLSDISYNGSAYSTDQSVAQSSSIKTLVKN